MKFCKQELSNDSTVTKHFLSIVQTAARKSFSLKQKIKDYFNKLEITISNMEEIRFVICSISKFEFLSYIYTHDYLKNSLKNGNSHEFFKKWFQCFLANNQIQNDIQQEKLKALCKDWIDSSMYNYTQKTQILMAIDELLNTFDKSDDNDWFYLYFIDAIINCCFEKGFCLNLIFRN
jgi:hypothetical protein